MPRMRTIAQAAEETGLTYHFIRQLILTGRFHGYVKVGTKTMINMERFAEFLNGGVCHETREQVLP